MTTRARRAPARPCVVPGCPHLVRGSTRCPDHALPPPIDHRTHRLSATERGYTPLWRRLVRIAIALQPACSICGSPDDLTGDHVVPLSRGGTSTPENVRVLCRRCNSRKGNH